MSFNRSLSAAIAAVALSASVPVLAADDATSTEALMKMIRQQQEQLDALKAVLAKTQKETVSALENIKAEAAEGSFGPASGVISLSGLVEIEATNSEDFDGADASDIVLATVELGVDANLSDWVSGHALFLFEEDENNDNIAVDEGFVSLGNTNKFPVYANAGRLYVPFGVFDTDMGADPLTLNLAETRETALAIGAEFDGAFIEGYVFNGASQKAGESQKIDQFGAAAGYSAELNGVTVDLGAGYINNMADSDGLTDGIGNSASSLNDYVAGLDLSASVGVENFTLRGEYITALDSFNSGELAFNGTGAEPVAWHAEGAMETVVSDRDVVFALTAQGTDEAVGLSLPELRFGAAVTVSVFEHASVTAEFLHDEDYGTGDGGTGETGHTATLKLAAEF